MTETTPDEADAVYEAWRAAYFDGGSDWPTGRKALQGAIDNLREQSVAEALKTRNQDHEQALAIERHAAELAHAKNYAAEQEKNVSHYQRKWWDEQDRTAKVVREAKQIAYEEAAQVAERRGLFNSGAEIRHLAAAEKPKEPVLNHRGHDVSCVCFYCESDRRDVAAEKPEEPTWLGHHAGCVCVYCEDARKPDKATEFMRNCGLPVNDLPRFPDCDCGLTPAPEWPAPLWPVSFTFGLHSEHC